MIINLLAGSLLVVAAYLGWWSIASASLLWFLPAVVLLGAALGLVFRKRWAQYLWHVIAFVAVVSWLVSVLRVAWSGWPYDSILASAISLLPGLLLVTVCAAGSAVVAKHFRGKNNAL